MQFLKPINRRFARAYTLVEVLAASAVVAVGMTAAVSLSATLMIQEEMAWRVAVTRNYQENMARLWQLGLSPADVTALMPTQAASPLLNQMMNGSPTVVETGTTNPGSLGSMQSAAVTAAVNISQNPGSEVQGAPLTLNVYRASLPSSLRPAAP
ncbi:MAG: prepilin-type N-terminal cleavage/methylation domain-containing protein [Prosthecobacter sp.]|nr:prepilin-type N-terminal cleavage/methylation domain-containing protein [Prosthecobacter sp.]